MFSQVSNILVPTSSRVTVTITLLLHTQTDLCHFPQILKKEIAIPLFSYWASWSAKNNHSIYTDNLFIPLNPPELWYSQLNQEGEIKQH